MTVAAMTSVELLRFDGASDRTIKHLRYLRDTSVLEGVHVTETKTYGGCSEFLLLWGPGDPARQAIMQTHVNDGGHVIALDLAYWKRDAKVRVSIDAPHPQKWVMRHDWPSDRYDWDRVTRGELWNPNGPVIIAGIGVKAKAQYGSDMIFNWEQAMTDACLRDGRKVIYRRKRGIGLPTRGAILAPDATNIDYVLARASLVITWHSNVAVDALRLGLPVVCRDGAAAAICPSEYARDLAPLPVELRDSFLRRLAYFQWGATTHEARGCWRWLKELMAA